MNKQKKVALITGVTGQDGALLSKFLLDKNYIVHGINRRSSTFNTERIDDLINRDFEQDVPFYLHHADMSESESLLKVIAETEPDEIYNLAAQSHVAVSFQQPIYTADINALGTLRILEAIRILDLKSKLNFIKLAHLNFMEKF